MDSMTICKAKSKQSGKRCKNFASKGKLVCRIHGGCSTGAKTVEGKQRQKMASWKHGLKSKEAREENCCIRVMIKKGKQLLEKIHS